MTSPPWTPPPEALQQHPELAHLALLAHHLRVLTDLFTILHAGGDAEDPLLHQARGTAKVTRPLNPQIKPYGHLRFFPRAVPAKPTGGGIG